MKRTWLILDMSNLCYRAFYTTGGLSYDGDATGVLYGMFRDIISLQDLFSTNLIVFAFDGGYRKRKEIYPEYKCNRKKRAVPFSEDELELMDELRRQIVQLRVKHLPEIGFMNIAYQEGYEADDLIAQVSQQITSDGEYGIIVSSDQDLYQCLDSHVTVWKPSKGGKMVTEDSFQKEWRVSPRQWAVVKSISGCKTDDVPGVMGVGEKTAVKFLNKELKKTSKVYQRIVSQEELCRRNLRLTKLPIEGTEFVSLVEDNMSKEKWDSVMESLGMKSLRKLVPKENRYSRHRLRKGKVIYRDPTSSVAEGDWDFDDDL